MDDFQLEVIERLTRLETTLNNGVRADISAIKEWISRRPRECPVATRNTTLVRPVVVAIMAALGVKMLDWGPALVTILKGP